MTYRTNEHQLIYKDNRDPWLDLITKGIPIYDCPIRNSPKLQFLLAANHSLRFSKDLCKKDCTKCDNAEAYGRSDPLITNTSDASKHYPQNPGKGKMPAEVQKNFQKVTFYRLVPISEKAEYHHLIAEIPTSKGPVYLMRNGSNLGGYNFVIIIENKYHWANNLSTALDLIDLESTAPKDLPLLIGRLRTDKSIRLLEERLR